jgi:hypothetical protein
MPYTPSGVRLRFIASREGSLTLLILPEGTGIGAESLSELAMIIEAPRTSWLVDLPGDGSDTDRAIVGEDPYAKWPKVLVDTAQVVENPVFVGHSTGGMYLFAVRRGVH